MNDQVLLTFVVPCYNVERYVQRCLDSIYGIGLNESCFEVLCVNDCSPDNVNQILERNMSIHDNMRIIVHEENKGLGGARNTGIREARGEYIWFVDSDDEVIDNGFEAVLERAVSDKLDVLCFNYCRIDDSEREMSRSVVFKDILVTDGYDFAKKAFPGGIVKHMGFVWRFLYRTDYLRSKMLSFPKRCYWEDTVFMPKSILLAERVASVQDVFYAYRVNSDSISGVFGKAYPAKFVYDLSFGAGRDLLRFSEEVEDGELRTAFHDAAVKKYINGYAIHLFRTDKKERRFFYKIVNANKQELKPLRKYLTPLNKILLIIPVLTDCCSMLYKVTH